VTHTESVTGIEPGTPEYRRALLALFAVGLSTFALIYTVQPLLALIGADFGQNASQAALLMSTTTGAIALAVIPLGALSARVGRGNVIIGSLAVAIVCALAMFWAQSWELLVILRTVQGIAIAGPPAAAIAWVAEEISPRAVTRVGGLYIAGTTVGGMSGRIVAGFAADLWGWRWGILTVAIISAILAGFAHLIMPRSTATSRENVRTGPRREDRPELKAQRVKLYALGGLGMAMFVGVFNVIGFRTALPPYSLGAGIGSMFFLTYLAGTFTSSAVGRIQERLGPRLTVLTAIATMAVGVALTMASPILVIWLGLLILCAGFFAMHALASSSSSRLHPQPSMASGIYLFCYYFGSSVGGIALGAAWDAGKWSVTAGVALAIIAVLGVIGIGLTRTSLPSPHVRNVE